MAYTVSRTFDDKSNRSSFIFCSILLCRQSLLTNDDSDFVCLYIESSNHFNTVSISIHLNSIQFTTQTNHKCDYLIRKDRFMYVNEM